MPLNWTTGELMRPAGCLPCCSGGGATPTGCECALLIPPFGSPYADYATAEGVISDYVANCLAFLDGVTVPSTFTADPTTPNQLSIAVDVTDDTGVVLWSSISIAASGSITIPYSATITTSPTNIRASATLYDCATGDVLDSDSTTGASGSLGLTPPSEGEFFISVSISDPSAVPPLSISASVSIQSSVTAVFNPVIALWDDSGTTRHLWACPKLLLPPLTEDTGTWYADCASADTVLTSSQVSNCVGYIESLTNVSTFTATDGGTSLTLAETLTSGATSGPRMWGGINAIDGATITITNTAGAGTPSVTVNIYDDTGTLVEASGTTASAWVSSALPYKGRYTVSVVPSSSTNTTSLSVVITSSGTMSVNPIAAAYDAGLTCPALLSCGDSCP